MKKTKTENTMIKPVTRKDSLKLDITDERNIARYQNEIDRVFDGSLFIRKKVLLGKPPQILEKYGIVKPLYCDQKVIRKTVYPFGYGGGKHNLGMSLVKALPYELEDPLAITQNIDVHKRVDNSIVVWTKWKTEKEHSVITIIRIEKNGEITITNNIVTIFASGESYLKQLIEDDNKVLYTKNNKSINQLLASRCIMPRVHTDDTLVKRNLSKKNIEDKKQNNKSIEQ